MRLKLKIILLTSLTTITASAQKLLSGPMLAHVDMRTARIWFQTLGEAEVKVVFSDLDSTTIRSKSQCTKKESFYIALIELDSLQPNTIYNYKVYISNNAIPFPSPLRFVTNVDWAYRMDPPAFDLMTGSCAYFNEEKYDRPGKPYGQSTKIFQTMANFKPDFMLWLGDNTYLRPADFNSLFGYASRYTHSRSQPDLQTFLSTCPHYAIWDDHDYGPNDANGSHPFKKWSHKVFSAFWPNAIIGSLNEHDITGYVDLNGIDLFMLDNRTYRQQPGKEASMLGKPQIEWLIQNLKYSNSPFKLVAVGGQVLNSYADYENMSVYENEREYLLNRIREEKIKNIVFLTGDRHHTELSKVDLGEGIEVYDFTCSPLSSGTKPEKYRNEPNMHRVNGTNFFENNFGILRFSGPQNERRLQILVYSADGELAWERTINSTK